MEQFSICRVRHVRTGSAQALVVILQRDMLAEIRTRLVAPLEPVGRVMAAGRLHPRMQIEGVDHLVMIERMAAVDASTLIATIHRADAIRDEIVRAIDFLITD